MPVRNPETLAVVKPLVVAADEPMTNAEIHAHVEEKLGPFDEADSELLRSRNGKSYYQKHWHRTVRRALDDLVASGEIAHIGKGLWRRATADAARRLSQSDAWELVLQEANRVVAQDKKLSSPIAGWDARVVSVDAHRIDVQVIRGNKQKIVPLIPHNVERAVGKLNAAGGVTGRHALNNNLAREIAIVSLHPRLNWIDGGDRIEVTIDPSASDNRIDVLTPGPVQGFRRDWSEGELLVVLSLYRQLTFGQMDARTDAVKSVAKQIARTPSAVALKLVNFASLDPTLQARGVKGMANTSRLDREMWHRYSTQWEVLAEALPPVVDEASEIAKPSTEQTVVERLRRVRVGAQFFRNAVLSAYDSECCITGIKERVLLRASHIMPWASAEEERLNPANGLCLNTLHDAAFDRGLMTFDESFRVMLSRRLEHAMSREVHDRYFATVAEVQLRMPERSQPDPSFLAHHRATIFIPS